MESFLKLNKKAFNLIIKSLFSLKIYLVFFVRRQTVF